jgi:two-component system NtrC family sensor kinase
MSNHNILIVDDEPNILKSLRRLLIGEDYKVYMASSGVEGLTMCEKHDIHLILSDYRMPEMNGVEFLSRVKEKFPIITRVVLSGFADTVSIVEAINEGHIYKFLPKPWDDRELLQTIKQGLDMHDLIVENTALTDELSKRNTELQELNIQLEHLVRERTHELEMNVHALSAARNVVNFIPMGIIGVDAAYTLVYLNTAMKNFLPVDEISLGSDIRIILPEPVLGTLADAISTKTLLVCRLHNDICVI